MSKAKLGNILVYGLTGLIVTAFVTMAITGIISLTLFALSPLASAADNIQANEKANAECMRCHGKTDFSVNRNGQKINLYVDIAQYKKTIHGTNACTSCHTDLGGIPHKKAVYGKALALQVNNRCQACHDEVARIYNKSIHGERAQMGKDSALCADCHGSHNIFRKENKAALTYWENVPQTCTKCHNGNVKKAYNYSFHGISVRRGFDKSPTCFDCHGAHQILGPANPASMVSKANVAQTCAKCHAKASAGFANGFEHRVPQDKQNAFSMWIVYKVFIGLIMFDVFMSGSIILFELSRKYRAAGEHQEHSAHSGSGHGLGH